MPSLFPSVNGKTIEHHVSKVLAVGWNNKATTEQQTFQLINSNRC